MIRAFIRHPLDVPIHISEPLINGCVTTGQQGEEAASENISNHDVRTQNISTGGVSLVSHRRLSTNSIVKITIPLVSPPFVSFARVVWCKKLARSYELGLQFMQSEDEFAARMVEQICHIEHYRRQVLHQEGRRLTPEEAAQEWIGRYAAGFPH